MSTHSKLKSWSLLPRVLVILMAFSVGRAFAEQVTAFPPVPAAGTGTSQLFTFHASDSSGYGSIPSLNVIINSSQNTVNACYFDYNRDAQWIGLADNGATTFGTGGTLGSSTPLSNSQCAINLTQSSVTGSGNDLYLTVAITLYQTQAFSGSMGVYEEVFNSAGQNGGWFWVGTWTVGTSLLAPDSIFPPSGTGGTQTFTFTASSPGGPGYSGYTYIDDVFVQFNWTLESAGACFLLYSQSGNSLWLVNDTGTQWTGGYAPGTANTLSNSQCSINAASVSVSGFSNTLVLKVPVTFYSPAFIGPQNVYADVTDRGGASSGYQLMASWTTYAASSQLPSALAPTQSAGTGMGQSFTFHASDVNGFRYIPAMDVIFNSSLNTVNACYFAYDRAAGWVGLADNNATTFGTGGTLGSSTVLGNNSQCSINLAQSSASGSGNDLYLTLAITFTSGFAGAKNVYEQVYDHTAQNTGWVPVGTWNVGVQQPLGITTSSLRNGPVNVFYSQTLTAAGGTGSYTWSVASGSVPSGLSLSAAGALLGTPTTTGSYSFTARVTDSWSNTATAVITLTIWDFYLTAQPSSQTVTSGSTAQFTVITNPVGGFSEPVVFSANPCGQCTFSPNPTSARQTTLNFPPSQGGGTITIYGQFGSVVRTTSVQLSYTSTIPPSVTCSALPNPVPPGQMATFTAYPSAGNPPYTFTWSGAVAGTGQIKTFQSSTAGTYSATIAVQDAHGASATNSCSLTVQSQSSGSLTIRSNSPLPLGTIGASYSTFLAAAGGTSLYTWSVSSGSLPGGLSLTAAGGRISGTPTASSTSFFTLQVTDINNLRASGSFSMTVARLPSNLSVSCASSGVVSPGGTVTFSAIVSGGAAPYTYSWSNAVSGNGSSMARTFGQAGTYTANLTVADAQSVSGPASCSALVTAQSSCTLQNSPTDEDRLVLLGDGTLYGRFSLLNYDGQAWQNEVLDARLYYPNGGGYPNGTYFSGQDVSGSGSQLSAVELPGAHSTLSALGFGQYVFGAHYIVANASCGVSYDFGYGIFSETHLAPTLSNLLPSSGAVGVVATGIAATGAGLSGTTGVVITDQDGNLVTSISTSFDVQDDNDVNLTLDLTGSGVTPGTYNVALTSFGVNTGPQTFQVIAAVHLRHTGPLQRRADAIHFNLWDQFRHGLSSVLRYSLPERGGRDLPSRRPRSVRPSQYGRRCVAHPYVLEPEPDQWRATDPVRCNRVVRCTGHITRSIGQRVSLNNRCA